MPPALERTPRERETLIFSTPEAAQTFSQEVQEKLRQEQTQGIHQKREVVSEAVAAQFAREGEAVGNLRQPWEHTPEEHTEAQQLVDLSFAKDLGAAVRQARKSPHYPRNLDLFHDVLTSEMYDLVREHHLNRQPLLGSAVTTIVLLIVIGALCGLLFSL